MLLKGDYAPPSPPTPRKLNSVKPWFQRLDIQKIKLNYQIRKKERIFIVIDRGCQTKCSFIL